MRNEQVAELLYQAYEVEQGGVKVYETALKCAEHDELREEWEEYLEQTREHVNIVREVMEAFDLDPEAETPGRGVCRHLGESLVKALEMALESGVPGAAQIVAAECVVLAETKDHLDWGLIGLLAEKMKGDEGKTLKAAHKKVEEQEDEHLYHTQGWARELWVDSLGMPAVLPPPEEQKDVKSASAAERAKHSRTRMKKSASEKSRTKDD
jgi:rubrerythrin